MRVQRSDALVFFGATGDLAFKKIFPALQAMILRGHLDTPIIGIAKSAMTLDQFKAHARDSLEQHGGCDPDAYEKLCSLLRYIDGDYKNPETFEALRKELRGVKRPLYYLAIPPSMFATVAEGLAASACIKNARVVVEKPFGRNLQTAMDLNTTLHRFFPESSIFRIDHYLGKEPVQNLLYFRFANPQIDAIWNNGWIDNIQITMAEDFGVAGRGKFYEEAGAIRDVLQNHMLETVACLAMDRPKGKAHKALRKERARLLNCVETLDSSMVVRGQFRGYRNEPGVAPDSEVETFTAVRFQINNRRWKGIPFYVRAGKCLPISATEIFVSLKRPLNSVLDDLQPPPANFYRFRLSPGVLLAFGTNVKKPGEAMVGERMELVASHQSPDDLKPYERLLGDAMNGIPMLFTDEDAVISSWRIVDQVLSKTTPLFDYEPGSWGPTEVSELLAPPEGWHDPKPEDGD